MPASVIILQPAGLAAAFIVASVVAVAVRRTRHRAARGRAIRFRVTAVRGVMYAALAAVAATLLAMLRGPFAHVLLGVLAVVAGAWLATELYQRESLSAARRRLLVLVRICAWMVLLVILGQPACERTVVTWDKPVLAVLLDHSESMGIVDPGTTAAAGKSRAALVNEALAAASDPIDRLAQLYDVRLLRIGARPEPATSWNIQPVAPLTGVAAALRAARELRAAPGRPPPTVLLISDGAENMADAAAVRRLAEDLASQRTALWAVGVGPEPGQTPLVELDPLIVPPRVGVRDLVHVSVSGRVRGCCGQVLQIEVLWNDQVAERTALDMDYDVEHLQRDYELVPPGPGMHRLTARVTLPEVFGGQPFMTSAVIDVGTAQVRVLYLERVPHFESRFAMQAWQGDRLFDVTRCSLLDGEHALDGDAIAELIHGYDVVVMGRLGSRIPTAAAAALADAVIRRGVGLLLSGGTELLNSADFVNTELARLCPVHLSDRQFGLVGRPRFVPTAAGLRHPALQRVATGETGAEQHTPADERAIWDALPPLGGAAACGKPKPAAVVLAVDADERPLLAAQEVGRGRCLVAAWESTWPWALVSDEGQRLHERLWRQMVGWLANRRPRAWVVTDEAEYALTALGAGDRRVRIHAGMSGLEQAPGDGGEMALEAALVLRPVSDEIEEDGSMPVPLRRIVGGWTAELPDWAGQIPVLPEGRYELTFTVTEPEGTDPVHAARTLFSVVARNVERRAPTANLPLLKAVAQRTATCGGRYVGLAGLPGMLAELARTDLRRKVLTPVRYDLTAQDPWGLLAWLVLLLGLEWIIRKRSGLS